MKCIIQCNYPYQNKYECITLNDKGIYYDDGRYERLVIKDYNEVQRIYLHLFNIFFAWKQEYEGAKTVDGIKYLIELELNHRKRKYKVYNKFPENFEEFLEVKRKIIERSL